MSVHVEVTGGRNSPLETAGHMKTVLARKWQSPTVYESALMCMLELQMDVVSVSVLTYLYVSLTGTVEVFLLP